MDAIPEIPGALLLHLHRAIKISPRHGIITTEGQHLLEGFGKAQGRGTREKHSIVTSNLYNFLLLGSRDREWFVHKNRRPPLRHLAELREMHPSIDALEHHRIALSSQF